MNKLKQILFNIIVFAMFTLFFSGKDCNNYYLSEPCRSVKSPDYKTYLMSSGTAFKVGQKLEFNLTLMGKKSYIISLCTEEEFSPLKFRILDRNSRSVIYDNSSDNYNNSIGFKSKNPCNIIVVVNSIPFFNTTEYRGKETCVGLFIQYKLLTP